MIIDTISHNGQHVVIRLRATNEEGNGLIGAIACGDATIKNFETYKKEDGAHVAGYNHVDIVIRPC